MMCNVHQTRGWLFALAAELRQRPARRRSRLSRSSDPDSASLAAAVEELQSHTALPSALLGLELGPANVVQGLFADPGALVGAMVGLAESTYPSIMVYGLGLGGLELPKDPEKRALGGAALERGRAALWAARREQRHCVARGLGEPDASMLSYQFELMESIRSRWTPRQAATVRAARRAMGKDVAAEFGVSPSVVSESLKLASYRALQGAERACVGLLAQFGCSMEPLPDGLRFPAITDPVRSEIVNI